MTKKICASFILIFLYIVGYSQERENRGKVAFDKQSEVFSDCLKWYYSDYDGEWNSLKPYASVDNGFDSIVAKSTVIDGIRYYIMFLYSKDGYYDYPEISYGFHTYDSYTLFLFTEDEYERMFTLTNKVSKIKYERGSMRRSSSQENEVRQLVKGYYRSEYFWIYKATDGSIRFMPNPWNNSIKDKYYETTEAEWNKLNIL